MIRFKNSLFFGTLFILTLVSCQDKYFEKYTANVPIYTDFETFRTTLGTVNYESPKVIEQKGNIYFKDNFLFIIDNFKGIHVIDNSNPSQPLNTAYYSITGITGMAIKNNLLYTNSYIDLVVIDISSINSPDEVYRVNNVFETALPNHDPNYPITEIDNSKGIITGWKIEEYVSEKRPVNGCFNCRSNWGNQWAASETMSVAFDSGSGSSMSQGVSGSITKFTLLNDYLYIMDGYALKPFDLSIPSEPTNTSTIDIWREVETLFSYNDHIFMGTTTGLLIYNTTNKNQPEYTSAINHVSACDPVVVSGDYAYVTLRTGSACSGQVNQLDVIDIKDYNQPILKESFMLENPHGLGIISDHLFVCDGKDGLKVYDASVPEECGEKLVKRFKQIQATDIILIDNIAMLIGDDGIYQYQISDLENIKELGHIKF